MADVVWSELVVHGNVVRYAETGADSGGPVVLLVHGIASRASQWEQVMAVLGETCHVLAPDLLGHGGSAKPRGDYSLGAHACGLRDLLVGLGLDRVSIVGHSLGGGIAMQLAYQFPERVERLALVCSGGLGREVSIFLRAATLPGAELVLPLIAAPWLRSGASRLRRLLAQARVPVPTGLEECLSGVAAFADREARQAFLHTARGVIDPAGQRIDARERLFLAADLPLFLVWGRKDAVIPVSHGEDLVRDAPGTTMEVFEQSGHFPHVTEPRRLAEVLQAWVSRTPPAALDSSTLTARLRPAQALLPS